jgi:hypothetical protein
MTAKPSQRGWVDDLQGLDAQPCWNIRMETGMRTLRKITLVGAAGVLGVAATLFAASPAQAGSTRCHVGSSGNCTTSILAAHPTGHFVEFFVDNILRPSPCPFRVRDVNSRVIVRSGTVATNSRTDQIVQGLYGYYQLELRGCSISAEGYLDNV